jgi:hypothetical protein
MPLLARPKPKHESGISILNGEHWDRWRVLVSQRSSSNKREHLRCELTLPGTILKLSSLNLKR